MTSTILTNLAAWLATYAIHSTLLIAAVALFVRLRAPNAAVRDFAWKLALVGAIATSTIQQAGNLRPLGSLAFVRTGSNETLATGAAATLPQGAVADRASDIILSDAALPDKRVAGAKPTRERSTAAPGSAPINSLDANAPATAVPNALVATETSSPLSRTLTILMVVAWGAVALLLALTYVARRLMLAGRLVTRRTVTEGRMRTLLDALRLEVGFDSPVSLTAASTIASPVALGLAEICVPEAAITDLDEEQQRGLLAHELAHLHRRDPLWLDAASLIERVFFFQPLNRLARRELQNNAEYICDDWAAAHTGSGEPLARCLARVAEWIEASPLGVPVAGMAEQRSLLVTRISRLLEDTPVRFSLSRLSMIAATLVALIAVVAAVPAVHATAPLQQPDSAKPSPTASEARGPSRGGSRGEPRVESLAERRAASSRSNEAKVESLAERESMARLTGHRDGPLDRLETGALANLRRSVRSQVSALGMLAGRDSDVVEQDPAVVTALIERLADANASVRRAAAQSLGNLKARRAVAALTTALTDKNREVRAAAANALGNIQDPKSIPALVKLMGDESAEVREHAINALSNFEGEVPVAPMIAALGDARPDIRSRAANILANSGDASAVAPLSKLLKDPVADVRREALQALSRFRDASVAGAISGALADENPDVRASALQALHELNATVPETTLLKALGDNSREVRQQAVQFLREKPLSAAVVAALAKLIADDPSADVKEAAVETLGEARSPAARDAIKAALNSPDARVRRAAAEALGNRP